jgi:PRTRC genetic system ThiF family protein
MDRRIKHFIPSWIAAPSQPVQIVLIGAGGTGSQVVTGLARMHYALRKLGHPGFILHVIDGDKVSEANIGRQIFSPSDIGKNKAEVLVTRVNTFFGMSWIAYPMMVSKEMKIDRNGHGYPPIILTAVDTAIGRIEISSWLRRTDIRYWLDFGNKTSSGQVILGTLPGNGIKQPYRDAIDRLPTILDLYPDMQSLNEKDQGPSCSMEEALQKQDLFINQWVASAGLEILWKCFRKGYITESGAFISLNPLTVRTLPIDPETWSRMGWEYKVRKRKKAA